MAIEEDPRYEQFRRLTESHYRLIRLLCWQRSAGRDGLCEELIHDCYVSIWLNLSSLKPGSHPLQQTAWVVWQCRHVFSHRGRRKVFHWLPLDEQLTFSSQEGDSGTRRELIEELAVTLTPKERHLLSLILEGYTQKEIAAMTDTTPEAVKKMRHRIVSKMANNVEPKN